MLVPGKLYKVKFNRNRWPNAKYLTFTKYPDEGTIFEELKEDEVVMYVDKLRHHKHLFLINGKVCQLKSYMKDSARKPSDEGNDTIDEWIVGPL